MAAAGVLVSLGSIKIADEPKQHESKPNGCPRRVPLASCQCEPGTRAPSTTVGKSPRSLLASPAIYTHYCRPDLRQASAVRRDIPADTLPNTSS